MLGFCTSEGFEYFRRLNMLQLHRVLNKMLQLRYRQGSEYALISEHTRVVNQASKYVRVTQGFEESIS